MQKQITVYRSEELDGESFNRIEYNGCVIQIIAVNNIVWNCVIDSDGKFGNTSDVVFESQDLQKCIKFIDKRGDE